MAINETRVGHARSRARLLGELVQGIDVSCKHARAGLARQGLADRLPAVGQVAADIGEMAPGQDPTLRDAHDRDEHRGREPESRAKAEGADEGQRHG